MSMIDGVFHRGDRVEFKGLEDGYDSMGPLKRGAEGIVVELYQHKQNEMSSFHFPVAVAWLGLDMGEDRGPQIIDGLDAYNLHEGDVVPMLSHELKVTGNVFTDV